MQFNLDLPYAKGKESEESNVQTSINLIHGSIMTANPQGFDGNGPQRRMYGRLQRKLDAIEGTEETVVDLEENEKDFIMRSLQTATLPAQWAKHLVLFEDALEGKSLTPAPGGLSAAPATQPNANPGA